MANHLSLSQLLVGDWMRLIPFGATVGGLSYLSLKGLANTPVVGPYIQVKIGYIYADIYSKVKVKYQFKIRHKTGFTQVCINVM